MPSVVLQRDRSRVPYNQAMIDDVNNEAWNFNPGILENIVTISQQRGYITGNQYILEKSMLSTAMATICLSQMGPICSL